MRILSVVNSLETYQRSDTHNLLMYNDRIHYNLYVVTYIESVKIK